MTETLHEPPPADPPPPPPPAADPRRLVLDPDDKVVAGVCAAFGRYTDTDPVLWRVTVAVLTLFGGAGLGLYALGWLLVPRAGQSQSAVERLLRRPDVSAGGVVLLVLGGVVLLALLDDGDGVGALLVVAGIAYLVSRERRELGTGGAAVPPPAPAPGQTYGPAQWSAPPPPVVPRPVRERSPLFGITVSTAALVAGLLLALRVGGVDGLSASRILATALVVVGAGLLVGTWYGRARWLLAVGLVLALSVAVAHGAQRVGLADGVGERTWQATDGGAYALGLGEARLDLSSLPGTPESDVRARIGVGHLVLLVPEDLTVRVRSDVDVGQVVQVERDGSRTEWRPDDGTRVQQDFVVGAPGDVDAVVDLEVVVGEIEVRRVAA